MKSVGMILSFSIAIIAVVAATVAYNNQNDEIILLSTLTTIATAIVAILWFQTESPRIPPSTLTSSHTETSKSSSADSELVATTRVYEVFLSFCGIDTRQGFTDFLYTYLKGASVQTFKDDKELRVGEELGPGILKAINESKIYIPILSPNFASSKWCLRELAEMVECCKNEKHKIYPVFYHVNPSVVKHQTGSYEKAFKKHKKEFDEETVERWEDALTAVSKLTGFELKKQTDGREGELVKIIVEKVLVELGENYTKVPENLFGIDNHVENLKGLLEVDSGGVRIVGIHGIPGLGKTTIAKVTYNQICGRFESYCFLNGVRENSEHRDGILHLQSQLLSKIQNRRVSIPDVDEGMRRLKNTFRGRKVLVVLDDVDEFSEVNRLIGNSNWFGAGSRIIITTTDSSVLRVLKCSYDTYASYEPKYMEDCDALKLFSRHAFMRDSPLKGYDYLSKEVVSIAEGLPLVLVVLGASFLEIKSEDMWVDRLKMLKEVPHKNVLKKLRFGFDTLEHDQKQIFLDIACFFTGWDVTMPCYMWNACGFSVREAINVLIRRSLISVGDDDKFVMHGQLRDLGREIVRTQSIIELGKRSRLWHEVEAPQVLETNQYSQGTRRVVALRLPFGRSEGPVLAPSFHMLQYLRYLSMGSYDLDGDFEHLLPNLRWLKWAYSGKFAPTSLPMKNLVILELSSSRFTKDLEIWSRLKMAKQLKLLDLSECQGLSLIPYLSTYASLEILKLEKFKSLCTLDGLEQLKSLKYLNASRCQHLETLPSLSNLTNLVELYLDYCEKLVEIQGLEKLEFLEVLGIRACRSLERLPNLSNLKMLRRFRASGCWKLIKIEGLEKLESLPILDISDCRSLERLQVSVWKECITLLSNGCVKLIEIEGLEELESLENLDLGDCKSFERLPDVSNFKMLKTLKLKGCSKLIMIPGLEKLESLEHLDLGDCGSLRRLPDVSNLRRLKTFIFKGCLNPSEIEGMEKLETLEHLDMGDCESLGRVLNLSNMKKLKTFKFEGCTQLIEIDSLKKLESLQNLYISDCTYLKTIIFSNLDSLENLTISNCEKLSQIEGLNRLRSLNRFNIARCPSLERIPDLPNFGMLKKMEVKFCANLYQVEELGVISLEYLSILYCDKVTEIRGLRCLKNLKTLSINSLKELTRISGLEELKSLESLSIIRCNSIEKLPDLNLEKLIEIQVSGCVKLPEISGVEDLKSSKELNNLLDFPNTVMQWNPTYYDSSDLVVNSEASKSLSSTIEIKNHIPETWLGNVLLDGEHSETSHSTIELENDLPQERLSDEMDWVSTHGETSNSITEMEQGARKTCIGLTFNSGVPNLSTNKGGPRHRHPKRQPRAKR